MCTTKAPGSTATIIVAFVATFAWLAGAWWLGWQAKPCAGGTGTYSCMTAPDWGTYLAGVFAPVTFFWLVAAVWVQSAELRSQREELALTREEFKNQRDVMQAQADESEKQAEFIGSQTKLLASEEEWRKLFEIDNVYCPS